MQVRRFKIQIYPSFKHAQEVASKSFDNKQDAIDYMSEKFKQEEIVFKVSEDDAFFNEHGGEMARIYLS
jgi:hypothetical protein